MATTTPRSLTVRTYDVGFGDCFLLSFHYARRDRHVLIDFGTMRAPKDKVADGKVIKSQAQYMKRIAEQIASDCGGRLDVVVATHRHQDHVSGFMRSKGKGPGEIIRGLQPRLVLQPWTEDPRAAVDATAPTKGLHVKALKEMQVMAGHLAAAARTLRGERFRAQRAELQAIGMDNISNRDAVENLRTMARNRYVYHGRSAALGAILPGVKVSVLGPPTVEQTDSILKQRSRDVDEFWHLNAAFWHRLALTARHHDGKRGSLFPRHPTGPVPRAAGWFKFTVMQERAESLLSIVRTLDKAMNNTSVILLFEVDGKSILFPGDAQYENWMYALGKPAVVRKLAGVDLYKVGHHGSLNATPKTLWDAFKAKGATRKPGRLKTLLSTKEDVHGSPERKTEVPRRSLVNALRQHSDLTSTEEFRKDELVRATTLEF